MSLKPRLLPEPKPATLVTVEDFVLWGYELFSDLKTPGRHRFDAFVGESHQKYKVSAVFSDADLAACDPRLPLVLHALLARGDTTPLSLHGHLAATYWEYWPQTLLPLPDSVGENLVLTDLVSVHPIENGQLHAMCYFHEVVKTACGVLYFCRMACADFTASTAWWDQHIPGVSARVDTMYALGMLPDEIADQLAAPVVAFNPQPLPEILVD